MWKVLLPFIIIIFFLCILNINAIKLKNYDNKKKNDDEKNYL